MTASFAPKSQLWTAATAYITGQLVHNAGTQYRVTANFTSPGSFNTTNLTAIGGGGGAMTAAEILAALTTVDGPGSGLDADTLDGISSAGFQPLDSDLTTLATAGNSTVLAAATASFTTAQSTKLSNLSGTDTGDRTSVTGNAGTATVLQTARNIDGQSSTAPPTSPSSLLARTPLRPRRHPSTPTRSRSLTVPPRSL